MERCLRTVILALLLVVVATATVQASVQVPYLLPYQGLLVDGAGVPVNDSAVPMTFRLYQDASGPASPSWTETRTVPVENGVYSVELGSVEPLLTLTPFMLGSVWLEVEVHGEVLAPRQRLLSSAYAFFSRGAAYAEDAYLLGGLLPSAYDQSAHLADTGNPHGVTAVQAGAATPADLAAHGADASAHHAKTTSFTGLVDQAADPQIPSTVTRDAEVMGLVTAADGAGSGLDADRLDGQDSTAFAGATHQHDSRYVNVSGDAMAGDLEISSGQLRVFWHPPIGNDGRPVLIGDGGGLSISGEPPFYSTNSYAWEPGRLNAIPATGAGSRMMWYPEKAAFRVGMVSANQWDDPNVGFFSLAMGKDAKASGKSAVAIGEGAVASGQGAIVLGENASASGGVAIGRQATTGGSGSAIGPFTNASGGYAVSLGGYTDAPSLGEIALGMFNTRYTPAGGALNWDASDRLLVVGNGVYGSPDPVYSDALVMLKDGRTGIGTVGTGAPSARLHVANPTIDNAAGKHTLYLTESNNTESTTNGLDPTKPYFGIGFRRAWNTNDMSNIKNIAGIYAYGAQGYRGGLLFKTENSTSATENPDVAAMVIRPDGNVGIGELSPGYKLAVNGTVFAAGAAGALSDRRHKDQIQDLSVDALAVVDQLRPVTFTWRDPRDGGMEGTQIGFIAQEVEEVLPEVVLTLPDQERTKGLKYMALVPVLTRAIQQQQRIIEAQQSQIEQLSRRLATLEAAGQTGNPQ